MDCVGTFYFCFTKLVQKEVNKNALLSKHLLEVAWHSQDIKKLCDTCVCLSKQTNTIICNLLRLQVFNFVIFKQTKSIKLVCLPAFILIHYTEERALL